jgi:sodium/proline symporter
MMGVALVVPAAALAAAGGPGIVWDALGESMPSAYLQLSGGQTGFILMGFVVGSVGMSLGALGQPHLLNRLMAIAGEAERRQGFVVVLGWGILVFAGMTVLGLSGRVLLPELASGELVFYAAATGYLPVVLAGVVIAATLSAVMSTVDSILLAAAAAVAHDMGVSARFPGRQLLVARLVMTVIAGFAVVLTLSLPDTIFNRVLFAWSALGAAFGPIVLWRVLQREVSAGLALASMLCGFLTTVLFYSLGAQPADGSLLSGLAHLPGDPFERVLPWLPSCILLALLTKRQPSHDEIRSAK